MTSLLAVLGQRIAQSGPITVAQFMGSALSDPQYGYYTTKDSIGRTGDFITAPEISQMFGELIGLWCADLGQRSGGSQHTLVEFGPGHGTLMSDAVRALANIPGCTEKLAIHLVEISPVLRQRQRQALPQVEVTWHHATDSLPAGPMLYLANEFYDALPTRQFMRQDDGWHERLIDCHDGALCFIAGPLAQPPIAAPILAGAKTGDIVEYSPSRTAHATGLAQRIATQGGAALIIDYGPASSALGDSLQAVRGHAPTNPLADPGLADLTTHVDFAILAAAAKSAGARIYGPVTQSGFLRALGIEARANTLLAAVPPDQRRQITTALDRLIAPNQMGTLFKVLAIAHPDMPAPAGFI
ncbi:MAG: class I SAM-dependent methyltransferase [Alphaproteobacteria bacterium]